MKDNRAHLQCTWRTWVSLVALLGLVACSSSPNRGYWSGDFDGSVAGVVDFEINARGTKITGKMVGKTRSGQDFRATLEGILRQDYIKADFEGTSQSGYGVSLRFAGALTGSLDNGLGKGEWIARIKPTDLTLSGGWNVEQVEP